MGKIDLEAYMARQLASRVSGVRVEVEQKFRIQNVERIRKLLRRLGARLTKSGYEHNELFDMDGRLKEKEYKLRLRRNGPKDAWLTLKGPRQEGDSKQRMEVEHPLTTRAPNTSSNCSIIGCATRTRSSARNTHWMRAR